MMRVLGLFFGCFIVGIIGGTIGIAVAGEAGFGIGFFGALGWYLHALKII